MKKKALLISESSVYLDNKGSFIARGGGAACFHNIGKSLVDLGFDVDCYGIREFDEQRESDFIDGVRYERRMVSSRSSLKLIRYLIRAWLKSRDYDYVVVNQFLPHLLLPFIRNKLKIAVVHDVYKDKKGFWRRQFGFFTGMVGWVTEFLQLRFDKWFADKIMTVSEASASKIVGAVGKRVRKKIFINPYPIDPNEYYGDLEKEDFMLFVGRFVSYKHPEHVLYVIKQVRNLYPDFKAVFVVSRNFVETRRKFEAEMKSLGLSGDAVECVEFCPARKLKQLFGKAKVFVQPSYMEGQGIVVLEALASGTPVVAYDLPAYNGMLREGENCELVERGDRRALAMACVKVLKNYSEYHERCGVTLRDFSVESFKMRLEGALFEEGVPGICFEVREEVKMVVS